MKRRTSIHELRRKSIEDFTRKVYGNCYTIENINTIAKLINSYYRFAALDYRVFIVNNDEKTHLTNYALKLEERRDKWLDRLRAEFNNIGYDIRYGGIYPSICRNTDNHCIEGVIDTYFYE